MKVVRVLNNNIVATFTEDNQEAIVQGAGIGFQKKKGDEIDPNKIEKVFIFKDGEKIKFERLMEDIPIAFFQISQKIADVASKKLNIQLNSKVIISLTDHLCFAVERKKQGISLPNLMLTEVKALYPNEYLIGIEGLKNIEDEIGVQLDEDEAGYIAIHIINAELNVGSENTVRLIKLAKEIMKIIEEHFNIEFEVNTLKSSRLLTHLKFLARRILMNETIDFCDESEMYEILLKNNAELKKCLGKIVSYLKEEYEYDLSHDEQIYLMIHLLKIIK